MNTIKGQEQGVFINTIQELKNLLGKGYFSKPWSSKGN